MKNCEKIRPEQYGKTQFHVLIIKHLTPRNLTLIKRRSHFNSSPISLGL